MKPHPTSDYNDNLAVCCSAAKIKKIFSREDSPEEYKAQLPNLPDRNFFVAVEYKGKDSQTICSLLAFDQEDEDLIVKDIGSDLRVLEGIDIGLLIQSENPIGFCDKDHIGYRDPVLENRLDRKRVYRKKTGQHNYHQPKEISAEPDHEERPEETELIDVLDDKELSDVIDKSYSKHMPDSIVLPLKYRGDDVEFCQTLIGWCVKQIGKNGWDNSYMRDIRKYFTPLLKEQLKLKNRKRHKDAGWVYEVRLDRSDNTEVYNFTIAHGAILEIDKVGVIKKLIKPV